MQPIADERFTGATLRLSDLRFMMRKQVIDAAAMDIDLRTEDTSRHGAALDVPPWTAATPGTIPTNRAIGCVPCFPKREVTQAFLFVFVAWYPAGRAQCV